MPFDTLPNMALVNTVIEKLSFGHFPIPIKVKSRDHYIEIEIISVDRDTGAPALIRKATSIPPWFQKLSDFQAVCEWILDEVRDLFSHELQEFMSWDKQLIFDPHKPKVPTAGMFPQEVVDDLLSVMHKGAGQGKKV